MKRYQLITDQTKKNLFDAFWQLYSENSLNKITVVNICNVANYDRSTFYRYFTDISDILYQFEDNLINNLRIAIEKRKGNYSNITIDRFEYFNEQFGKYIMVLSEKGEMRFYEKFKELVVNDVFELFNFKIKDEGKKQFLYEFLFSSAIISYTYWYKHQEIMDIERYVNILNNILLSGSRAIIEQINK